ncbi:DUF6447 family protein [Synechococcus sp. HK01-R]|uniref:DUF6447 family protein n=1 Tax=Synechococcus sp. HK01-R TaxID=2751171 RepID=UPI001623E16E|nr:DUF6447 family protein [Synechococcus sp. HK01-R]QNG27105.1 hypothetical protein H0O21_13240 [Synechococcus sp. HK01-R]
MDNSTEALQTESASKEALLTIGDKSYQIASLPEDAQKLVLAIRDCEEQITSSKRRVNYLEIARRSLIQELTSRLPEDR